MGWPEEESMHFATGLGRQGPTGPGPAGRRRLGRRCVGAVGLLACVISLGCHSQYGGVTWPSPYYLSDDINYYAPGPEFKLLREATAMRENQEETPAPPTEISARPAQPARRPAG